MKSERLQNAIIEIDDDLIGAADTESIPTKRKNFTKWAGLTAACLIFAITTVIGTGVLKHTPNVTPDMPSGNGVLDKHVSAGSNSEYAAEPVFDWDAMTDTQRFPTLLYGGHEFTAYLITVYAENEGEYLGTTTMTGSYIKNGEATGELRTTDVKVYAIRGISTDIAVVVRFSDSDPYSHAYCDSWYTPETLSDFATKLNLAEYMKTGFCYYENRIGSNAETIVYEDIDTSMVWSMLLDDLSVKNEPDVNLDHLGSTVMSISTSIEALVNYNKTISLTENGYLYTNLLETGKFFFIGRDKVEAFVDEVVNHHQGYRYIYDLTEFDEVAE